MSARRATYSPTGHPGRTGLLAALATAIVQAAVAWGLARAVRRTQEEERTG